MTSFTETQINVQGEPQNAFEVYADETKEQTIAFCFDEATAHLIAAALETKEQRDELLEALRFTQTALANWRDGKETTRHSKHGEIHLEEVKYCVIDPAIKKAEKS